MPSTNPVAVYSKDPDAVLDYPIDWKPWLDAAGGDKIATSTWTLSAGIANSGETKSLTLTVIWLSGGTPGQSYLVANRITTVGGRTEERTIQINVVDR